MNWPRIAGAILALMLHGTALYALLARPVEDPFPAETGEGAERFTIVATVSLESNDLFNQAAQPASVAAEAAIAPAEKRPEEEQLKEEHLGQTPDALPKPPELVQKQDPVPQTATAATNAQEEQHAARALAARRAQAWSAYQIAVHAALERYKLRPHTRHAAEVELAVTIAPSGELLSRAISKSSGVPELDGAAIATMERAAPFPPIPLEVSSIPLTLTVPFEYRVK